MNISYLSTLTIVSILSLGTVAACSNPCAARTTSPNTGTEMQADPCAGKNPCASKTDPCASKADPSYKDK